MVIQIPLLCRPKKNSQQIYVNSRTGKRFITQSDNYKQFEKDCWQYLVKYQGLNIQKAVNLRCLFFVPDKRRRDIINLEEAIADILVKYNVLADDNYNIINSWDGSRIIYEKGRAETIIEIEVANEGI